MQEFHNWLATRHRVIGASHGTEDEPLHAKWMNVYLTVFEKTWRNLEEFRQWWIDCQLAA